MVADFRAYREDVRDALRNRLPDALNRREILRRRMSLLEIGLRLLSGRSKGELFESLHLLRTVRAQLARMESMLTLSSSRSVRDGARRLLKLRSLGRDRVPAHYSAIMQMLEGLETRAAALSTDPTGLR